MNTMYPTDLWQGNFFRQPTPQTNTAVTSMIPVYLGSKPGTERVVQYTTSNDGLMAKAEIQRYDERTNTWIVEYSQEAADIQNFMVLSGYWDVFKQNVIVLYYNSGSGNFLTYYVLGRKQDKVVELVKRDMVFQGSVWFEGIRIIESYGLRQRIWESRNRKPTLIPRRVPVMYGSVLINFSLSEGGQVKISKTTYNVPAGTTIQLIRTDLNEIGERVLFNYSPSYQYIPHKNAIKTSSAGSIQFTIIPGGYDWDKAVNVTIEVK